MATEIDLTNGIAKVSSASFQPLTGIIDVSKFDVADLLCVLHGWDGTFTGGGGPTIEIYTAMQADSDDLWYKIASFDGTTLVGTDRKEKINVTKLLKFLRWRVMNLNSATSISFSIRGMLRLN